ncbi:MAG: hypothetical protein U1F24_04180 [Alphaproteobacteria bacterium]
MTGQAGGKPRHFSTSPISRPPRSRLFLASAKALKARHRKGDLGDYLPLLGRKIALVFQQPLAAHPHVVRRRHQRTGRFMC